MLYEILSIILVIYACLSPFWVIRAVQFGLSVVEAPKDAAKEPVFNIPKKKKPAKSPALSAEEQRIMDILDNVEVFDGTEIGQKEISNERS